MDGKYWMLTIAFELQTVFLGDIRCSYGSQMQAVVCVYEDY